MSGLKEIRTRIGSIKTTRQVTSAMKMVSAAKLKKTQDAVIHFRPYSSNFKQLLESAIKNFSGLIDSELTKPRDPVRILIVLISSNRGLCGAFNAAVIGKASDLVNEKYRQQAANDNVSFLTIGKQGERFLKSHKIKVSRNKNDLLDRLNFENASEVSAELRDLYLKGEYDRIELVYNDFINAAQYIQSTQTFLPLQFPAPDENLLRGDIIFEPSPTEIAEVMFPMWLNTMFYKTLLLSCAAEHGARMTAMHQATDNATDLLGELTLQYNKARQAAITKEILEITGGAEALRS